MKIGGCANPDMVRLMREWLGPDGPRIVVGAVTVVGEDGDAARAPGAAEVEMYLDVVGRARPDARAGPAIRSRSSCSPARPTRWRARAIALIDAGAHRVEFGTPQGQTTEEGVALLCDRVLPAVRNGG